MKYIPGYGNKDAKLLLLLECPTYADSVSGKLLSKSFETDQLLRESGISKGNIWITSVSKYHIPPNEGKKKIPVEVRAANVGINLEQQMSDLRNELNTIKPNCILGLGRTPLWALTGKRDIEHFRGSVMMGWGKKFIPTFNPDGLNYGSKDIEFKGYYNKQIMAFDFNRALKQSEFPDFRLPHRNLQVAKSYAEFYDFYQRYKDRSKVSVDIESSGLCVPVCIGFAFHKSHGMTVPLWNTDGISKMSDIDMVNCWLLVQKILSDHEVIGQNFNYDRDKLKRLGFRVNTLISDLMMKAHAINPELPKRLSFNTSLYTEEPFYKDDGMYEGSYDDLFMGCARDACVTYEVDENMEPDLIEIGQRDFYYNFLMKLPDLYWEIERTGFGLDPIKREELIKKYVIWSETLAHDLWKLTGEVVNTNSPKQVKELLFDKLKCPRRDGTGEEELTAMLNLESFKNETNRSVVEKIMLKRRVDKTISTYMMAIPDYDGRLKTTCFPCLETGRSSNGQQEPPIRPYVEVINFDGKKKKKAMGIAFQTITKHGDVGEDIRGMMVP